MMVPVDDRTLTPGLLVAILGLLALSLLLFLTLGCSALRDTRPQIASMTVPGSPREVFPRAVLAFQRLGGEVVFAQGDSGPISGRVHNAVALTVTLSPVAEGTRVDVVGQVLPNKLVFGEFTEVAEYLELLR